jgi:MYXO-CTERM domain-containing protein
MLNSMNTARPIWILGLAVCAHGAVAADLSYSAAGAARSEFNDLNDFVTLAAASGTLSVTDTPQAEVLQSETFEVYSSSGLPWQATTYMTIDEDVTIDGTTELVPIEFVDHATEEEDTLDVVPSTDYFDTGAGNVEVSFLPLSPMENFGGSVTQSITADVSYAATPGPGAALAMGVGLIGALRRRRARA